MNNNYMIVEIDGNDGSGKSFLIDAAKKDPRFNNIEFRDRGLLSLMTLTPYYENINKLNIDLCKDIKYILVDTSIETSQKRILSRGDSLNVEFHTKYDLKLYRNRFLNLAKKYNINIINGDDTDINNKLNILYNYLNIE